MKHSVSNKSRSLAHPVATRRFRICSWSSEKASKARRASWWASDSRTRLPSCSGKPGSAVADASHSTRVGLELMLARLGPQKSVFIVSGLGERLNPTFGSTGQATGTRSTGDHNQRSSPAVLSANESHNSKFQRNILVGG